MCPLVDHIRADREDAVPVADRQRVRRVLDRELEARVPERDVVLQLAAGGLRGPKLRDVLQHGAAAPIVGERPTRPIWGTASGAIRGYDRTRVPACDARWAAESLRAKSRVK